jgi:hypothetical protein
MYAAAGQQQDRSPGSNGALRAWPATGHAWESVWSPVASTGGRDPGVSSRIPPAWSGAPVGAGASVLEGTDHSPIQAVFVSRSKPQWHRPPGILIDGRPFGKGAAPATSTTPRDQPFTRLRSRPRRHAGARPGPISPDTDLTEATATPESCGAAIANNDCFPGRRLPRFDRGDVGPDRRYLPGLSGWCLRPGGPAGGLGPIHRQVGGVQ